MKIACLAGAVGAALVGYHAAMFAVFMATAPTGIDPTTQRTLYEPWTLFYRFDGAVVFGFLLVALGCGWLAWHLCRRVFPPSHLGPNHALQRTEAGSGVSSEFHV